MNSKILLFSFLLLISCNSGIKKNEKSKINKEDSSFVINRGGVAYLDLKGLKKNIEKLSFNKICDSAIYVPLETSKKCLISNVNKIMIDDSNIFIHSGWRLFRFNINGKFLNEYGKIGRGPGEHITNDFTIDRINKFIYVITIFSHKLLKYTYSGRLISSFSMSSNVNSLHAIIYDSSKNHIVATSQYSTHRKGGESPYYNIIEEYNNKGKLINSIPSKYFPNGAGLKIYDNLSIVFSFNKLFLLDDSHIMVQEFSNDTLFEYKNNLLTPRIVLNNKDFIPRFKVSSSCKRSKDIKFDKDPYWLCIGGNNRFIFIRNIKSNSVYIYNRKDSKLRKCIFNSKYFDCIGSVPIDKVYANKYFMRLLSADKFLEKTDTTIEVIKKHQGVFFKQIQSIRKNITDESNPVLLIYRLRK